MTTTDLITLSEIAARAGVTPAAVSNWRRRHDTFPGPVRDDLFDAAQVDEWLSSRKTRTAIPKSGRRDLAWELLSISRGEVDTATAASVAASLVTLCHLDPQAKAATIAESAARLEAANQLPGGALSTPLREAARLRRETLETMVHTVREGLATSASASELFDDIVAFERSPRAAAQAGGSAILTGFLTGLAEPGAASVLDPACGTGTLLLAAAQHVGASTIQGYDVNTTAWALCAQRLVVNQMPPQHVLNRDFFAQPAKDVGLVICVPPFGSHFHREDPAVTLLEALGAGDSFKNVGDFAWLFATRNALSPTGTAIVVTPVTPTFAGGVAQRLRHELLRSGSVAAVIALPGGLHPNTMIPVVVWILKPPMSNTDRVLLINADSGSSRRPDPALLQTATREYQAWRDNPETYQPEAGFTAAVSVLELLAPDVALTPAKWTEVPTDPDVALDEARAALTDLTSTAAAARLQVPAVDLIAGVDPDQVTLHDLTIQGQLEVRRPRHINRDDVADSGTHPYVTGVTDEGPRIVGYLTDLPDHAVITQPGDVILSTLGQIRATVDRDGGHVLGSAVWLIRPTTDNPALQPDLLALLLASPRIAQQAVGTTVQRLRHPKDVSIPLLDPDSAAPAAGVARALADARISAEQLATASDAATLRLATALEAGVVARVSDRLTTVSNDRDAGQNGDTV